MKKTTAADRQVTPGTSLPLGRRICAVKADGSVELEPDLTVSDVLAAMQKLPPWLRVTSTQQSGNAKRRRERERADRERLEKVVLRHGAGEKWSSIAPDYGLSGERLRHLVAEARKAGRKPPVPRRRRRGRSGND